MDWKPGVGRAWPAIGAGTFAIIAAAGTIVGAVAVQAGARALTATPDTLAAVLQAVRGGQRVVLAPGTYGDVTLPRRTFAPALAIDATRARFTGLMIRNVGGVAIEGGTVEGPRERAATITVDFSHDIALRHMRTSGSVVGVSVSRSRAVLVADSVFDGMRSDGVNIAGSQDVRIERNVCRNFTPTLPIYDAAGKLVKDGNHPDCVQGWSIVGRPPNARIAVIGNSGRGWMQGVFFGNPGQGGIDGIVVQGNTFDLSLFNGIALTEARGARVTGNTVRTIPGARMLNYPFKPVTAWIKLIGGGDAIVCGNTVDAPKLSPEHGPCLAAMR